MNAREALEKLLRSYERFYDIKRDGAVSPFAAEAEFHSHTEQYLLVKAAHLSDVDSNEFVFFSVNDCITAENVTSLALKAWNEGLSRVKPYSGHRNSDVVLVLLADSIDEQAMKMIKKIKFYKSYKFSLWGWSHFKLIAMEASSGKLSANWHGRTLKKLFTTIN